jgi:hypothetical protein
MPWLASTIVLILSVIVFAAIGALFFNNIIVAVLNGIILYLLLYRAFYDWKKGRVKPYVIGLLIGIALALLLPKLEPLWPITFIVIIIFVVVETMRVFEKRKKKKK